MITEEELLELGFEINPFAIYLFTLWVPYNGNCDDITINMDEKIVYCNYENDDMRLEPENNRCHMYKKSTKANVLKFIEIAKLIGELE